MVCAYRYPGHLRAVFSRARPAARAGADNDARGRGRNERVVYATDAARGGACLHIRLPASAKEKMAADLWAHVARGDAEYLPAAPVQPQLRHASRRLVCAEPSGRRFRRDLRGLAHAGTRLAQALRGLEGAKKTRIRGRADALAGGKATGACTEVSRRRVRLSESQAQDLLRAQTEALRRYVSGFLRRRSAGALCRARRLESELLSALAAAAANELGLP